MIQPRAAGPGNALLRLSARERQVLELAASGLTNLQIAERLGVTVHAVKFHLAATYQKLGVANRTQAAYIYLHHQGGGAHSPDGEVH